jgi:hypothetical protein
MPPRGVPTSGKLVFEMVRNGSQIGTHSLNFALAAGRLTVTININTAVNIGPITVSRYTMVGTEVWEDGRFTALNTTTNDDGDHHQVAIRRTGDEFVIQSSGLPTRTQSGNAAPLTHWSLASLMGPLLNPQDGQPMPARITPIGTRGVQLADGRTVRGTGYDIEFHTPTQDWYDTDGIWLGLQAKIRDGSLLDYRRLS